MDKVLRSAKRRRNTTSKPPSLSRFAVEMEVRKQLAVRADARTILHNEQMLRIAKELSKGEKVDRQALRLGVLLHDVGKCVDWHTHHIEGQKIAEEILRALGARERTIEIVKECVRTHGYPVCCPDAPRSREAKIVHDADKISAMGPQGFLRYFYRHVKEGDLFLEALEKFKLRKVKLYTKRAPAIKKRYDRALREFLRFTR